MPRQIMTGGALLSRLRGLTGTGAVVVRHGKSHPVVDMGGGKKEKREEVKKKRRTGRAATH